MKTHIVAFALSMLITLSARAELKWEQTTLELHPTAADKQAIGHFKYQNPGKTPVRFKSVHASCGCTTAQTQKDEVPAGGTGEITATFNIGDRTGTQVKRLLWRPTTRQILRRFSRSGRLSRNNWRSARHLFSGSKATSRTLRRS